ncbi:SRPBCC family protein [Gordonia sp. ABSL1-1]|uniref:SRPBCC family protein n=1 Tax=Gordonia sp. ABSL1-1 TaxID=3053923 RepID=UPI002572408A|nr:SRPBCC family protein [Gordonia sp. ABSL1-1]MDL9937236.1 SRPBCC family protein [Gordonia sp. ABSL1-1]
MSAAPSRHISVIVDGISPTIVYDYAADPDNLPRWAAGLAADVRRDGDVLIADSPMGEVTVSFAPRNAFGILDHQVQLPDGTVVDNPLRVLAHPDGSEVLFTVRQRDLTADEFERDCTAVQADLDRLRDLLIATRR